MKAKFTEKQTPIRIVESGEYLYIFICLNEQEVYEDNYGTNDDGTIDYDKIKQEKYYEYDFNEIYTHKNNIDINDLNTHPEKYLNFKPEKEKSLEERIKEQEILIKSLNECLLEMKLSMNK